MIKLDQPPAGEERPLVTASMFGNTTECIEKDPRSGGKRRLRSACVSRHRDRGQDCSLC